MQRGQAGMLLLMSTTIAACGGSKEPKAVATPPVTGQAVAVIDTVRPDYFEATGVADPVERATISTRLMATVIAVVPLEGARVHRGDVLVRLDASDLDAKRKQVAAGVAEATAMHDLATVTASRMSALYADSAAPKAQLDAAMAGLARAKSGLAAAHAAAAELEASAAYAEVRAPFDGIVTHRFVDVGAFAAPGAPLLTVEASDRLRISAVVPAALARGMAKGNRIQARLEGVAAEALIEGVVPSGGNLYMVNAIVANGGGKYLAGSAATLLVATGERHVVLVPTASLVRQGDLVGVRRRMNGTAELTWLRIGGVVGDRTEVLSGLAAGDSVLVPASSTGAR